MSDRPTAQDKSDTVPRARPADVRGGDAARDSSVGSVVVGDPEPEGAPAPVEESGAKPPAEIAEPESKKEPGKKSDSTAVLSVDRRLLRRIVDYLLPYKWWVVAAFAGVLVTAFLGPLRPKIVQLTIDNAVIPGDVGELRRLVILLVAVLMGEGLLSFGIGYLTQWIGQQAIFDLRRDVFRHILRQPLAFFDKTPLGTLITRATSDVEALNTVLSAGMVTILGSLFQLVFITYFMVSLNWVLALVTLAVMPLMVWATFWFKRKAREQYSETRKQVAKLNSFLQEHITGMSIVQAFGREKEEMRRFEGINDDHRTAQIKTVFYFALFFPMVEIIAALAMGLLLWVGGLRALGGALTLGVLVAFIQYARLFFEPIRNLADQFNLLQSAFAGGERVFGLLDSDQSIPEPATPTRLESVKGRIEFRDVWFTYENVPRADSIAGAASEPDSEVDWILRGVSFIVEPGQTVAIVGATGAGKSTIISLLLRFYEAQRGTILLDGVDTRTLPIADLRQHIGLVLQDVFLFSGTVQRNLTLGDEGIAQTDVEAAAREIGAHPFIERLPEGYLQDVRERGANLSHGQRQLLSFVRALVYDPAILVLDEATSSVDTETEMVIQSALERLMEGRTALVIAHRLSTIRDADQILVLHRGALRERGTHAELLEQGGLYHRLYEMQYAHQEGV